MRNIVHMHYAQTLPAMLRKPNILTLKK